MAEASSQAVLELMKVRGWAGSVDRKCEGVGARHEIRAPVAEASSQAVLELMKVRGVRRRCEEEV